MKKNKIGSLGFLLFGLGALCASMQLLSYEKSLQNNRVDFHQSMENIAAESFRFAPTQNLWDISQKLYQDNVFNNLEYAEGLRIPRIVHHIWIGSSLPGYAQEFRKSWVKYCDGWTFILWTDHPTFEHGEVILGSFAELQSYLKQENRSSMIVMDMNKVVLHNQVALKSRARNYGEKSDIIRYEILYQVGGLYVDTDFECLKSFDDLHYALDFYVGIAYDHNFSLLNGLIGANAGDPILKEVINRLHNKPVGGSSLNYTGPYFLTEVFFDTVPQLKSRAVAFPLTYFYSMPAVARGSITPWIKNESYAIHHWKMSWM